MELNPTCKKGSNKGMFHLSSSATLPSALLTEPMETSALGAWKQKSDFFPLCVTDGGKAFVMLI